MKEFIPNTQTVNKDRKYFVDGDVFVKHDSVINRGVNEAEKLSVLDHPYIQKKVSSGIKGTYHELRTDFFEGETLENLVLSFEDIGTVKSQLLEVLAYLTKRAVIHQDINVSNVLWNGKQILVIDWESAAFCDGDQRIYTNIDLTGKHPHSGVLNTIKAIKKA
jgi:RIO-like serine/threonine protein kinase